jgi:Zn finger protein HypA/HybF involved in hydrogenase expression
MHEVSLVAALLDAVEREAGGRPVRAVSVRHASSISEGSLRQAFEMLTADGPYAATDLSATSFEDRLACACGFDGLLGHDDLVGGGVAVCPRCGDVSTVLRSAELELVEVAVGPG